MGFHLHSEQLHRLFPFHLHIGKDLQIVSAGRSLEKLEGCITGKAFPELFEVERPQLIANSAEVLASVVGELMIFRSRGNRMLLLRGQLEQLEDGGLFFFGSPWFSDMEAVTAAGLSLHDFAPHDPQVDMLQLVHAQEIATRDIQELYNKITNQSRQLQAVAKEKEQLASLPMQNPDPVLRIDTNGSILLKNPACDAVLQTVTYNGTAYSLEAFCQVVALEIGEGGGKLLLEAQSGDRTFSFTCYLLPEQHYINIYTRNITAQKLLEVHLQDTANRLRALISNLQAAVLLENENRTIALVNQRFCDLFSIPATPDQLIGTDCSMAAEQIKHLFRNPDEFVHRIQLLLGERLVAKGDVLELTDGRVLSRDFVPVFNGNTYLGHMWLYDDVTNEVRAREAMQAQRTFYEDILNNLPADIAVFNRKQEYLFLNPRAVKNPELRQWLIGKTDNDYRILKNKKADVYDQRKQLFQQLLMLKTPQQFEEKLRTPDGQDEYHLRIFFPVLNSSEDIDMIIGYGIDITERKKMEQQLKHALLQTEQEATRKERFFAAMSHEIRTPLNGILGVADLLAKSDLQSDQRAFTNMIRSSGKQLLRIVNDVLEFERITSGRIEPEMLNFDLVELIRQAADPFLVQAEDKKLWFRLLLPVTELLVCGDAYRIRQILNNLLSNALKFTETGGIQVSLALLQTVNRSHTFTISVADTGSGIEPQSIQSIFEPYTQAGSAISRKYGGTGLGLAISRQLAKLMNGRLDVTSTPTEGSTFTLELQLPVASGAVVDEEQPVEFLSAEARKELRLLIAEDAPINQFVLQQLLKQWGCSFQLVDNGQAVLKALETSEFDIILMDIEMPVLDGMQATRLIRESGKKWASIPIIALTANAMKGSREQYLAAGMNGYIPKPFQEQDLQEAIASILHTGMQTSNYKSKGLATGQEDHLRFFQKMSDDPAFIQQMKLLLQENIPLLLNQLKEAQHRADAEKLASALHQLKPLARMLALHETEALILSTESLIRSGSGVMVEASVVKDVTHHFKQVMEAIT